MILSRDGWSEGAVIVGKDGVEKQLPLDQTRKFSVFEREKITLAIGDRIRGKDILSVTMVLNSEHSHADSGHFL